VVVINEALAARFWPGQDPIGREIGGQGEVWRIVGVARDVQMRSLRSPANPGVYYPMSQMSVGSVVLHVRVDGPAERAIRELREVVAVVDPELPLRAPIDLRAAALDSVRELRVFGVLVTGFAVLALVLAAIGLYGLVAYGVSQRVREMGIRLALGAKPSALVGLVLRRSLMVSLVGVTVGLGLAVLLGKAIRGMLFGVSAGDPVTLLAAASILFATAALAAWIPARRAARVDATVSLRAE
jgi:ABC-type antimicrobial peptide transport system permease subunit